MARYKNLPPVASALDYDGWVSTQQSLIKSYAPAVTNFISIKPGEIGQGLPLGTADDADGLMVGGGVGNLAGAFRAFSNSAFQTPKTTSWGFSVRGILAAPVAGKFNFLGMSKADETDFVGIASYHTVDATNFILYINDGASETTATTSTASDGLIHTFTFAFNGTTQSILIDGSLKVTNTTLTNVIDQPMYLGLFATDAGSAKASRVVYGYIAP